MSYYIDFSVATSDQIETALCKRLENIRLARNITQIQLAVEAGVSPKTIGRLEKGQGVSVDTFIRVLTALGIQQNLEALLPDPTVRPIERIDIGGSERKRARPAYPAMNAQCGRGATARTTMNNDARVLLWGSVIGAVTWLEDREVGVFQYAPNFLGSGIKLAPLMMPLGEFPYEFPALARNTFKGLPGLIADSLPDKFGNAIIDAWLASQGRTAASFHPVERLCYIGSRGMGALEFEPATLGPPTSTNAVEVGKLVDLANQILDERA